MIRTGLVTMGAGAGLLSAVDGATERTRNGAGTRAELLREMDELVGMAVPSEGMGPSDRTGPLLQAGAWLEVTDLVASTLLETKRYDAANVLLRQPEAAGWFLNWVRKSAEGRAPEDQLRQVEGHLSSLRELAATPALGEPEIRAIRGHTAAMLALL
jgi:hypothetical protein